MLPSLGVRGAAEEPPENKAVRLKRLLPPAAAARRADRRPRTRDMCTGRDKVWKALRTSPSAWGRLCLLNTQALRTHTDAATVGTAVNRVHSAGERAQTAGPAKTGRCKGYEE